MDVPEIPAGSQQSAHSGLKFEILDVFLPTPETRFKGNQLGVVYLPKGKTLTHDQELAIAAEFTYSESIFIHMPAEGSESNTHEWTVDIFTVNRELPFAGHPTIGASYAIQRLRNNEEPITLQLKAGKVPVTYTTLQGLTPEKTKYLEASGLDRSLLASGSRGRFIEASIPHAFYVHEDKLSPDNLLKFQSKLAPFMDQDTLKKSSMVGSPAKGLTFVLIAMPSREALHALDLGASAGAEAFVKSDESHSGNAICSYNFYIESFDEVKASDGPTKLFRVHSRMLDHETGMEDPATGSAACTLSMALALGMLDQGWAEENAASKLLTSGSDIRANEASKGKTTIVQLTQGEQMGRKSVIYVRVLQDESGRVKQVLLGGFASSFAKGILE